MPSFSKNRIIASFFTVLVVAPMFFLAPLPFGGSEAHAFSLDIISGIFSAFGSGLAGGVAFVLLPFVYIFFVAIPKLFFLFAGVIFDTLVAFSLSGEIIQNQAFVDKGWVIMRDLSNTFFIFVLLWIAISTILQLAGGQTKRLLATLILVALFMNFSLYITKFVIDIGNVFALEFYVNVGIPEPTFITLPDITPRSIAASFKNAFDLEKFGTTFLEAISSPILAIFNMIIVGILYLVSTFVFLSAGFLFLARVVAFWFLMLLSPLAFFSMILPYTRGKIWSRWFSELIGQTFLAPVFLFFLYLTLMLLTTLKGVFTASSAVTSATADVVSLMLAFLNVFAICTVLLFGLKTAKGMSGELGASMLRLGGTVTGAAVGAGAWAGRNTVGRAARYVDDKVGNKLDESRAGRFVRSGLTTVSSSSFDARASKMGQLAQSTVGGINLGAPGGAGGHEKAVREKQKDVGEHTKKLLAKDPAAAASYLASHERFDPLGDRDTTAVMAGLSSSQRAELIANAKGKDQDRLKKINEGLGAGSSDKQKRVEAKGAKEYAKAAGKERREEEQEARVTTMNELKTKYAEAKDDAEKVATKKEAEETLKQMKGEEIADLDGDLLSHDIVAHHLSDKDLEHIERKSNLTKEHQEALYANIKANGREEAKSYLNLSPAVKRKNASKKRKWEAEDAEEALKRELKEADAKKEAETDTARRAKAEWDRVGENKTATVDGKPIE